MEDEKFKQFKKCFDDSFKKVLNEMTGMKSFVTTQVKALEGDITSVIIGTVGKNKGRIIFQSSEAVATVIAESMNGEAFEDKEERNIFLGEFVNTFCGSAITKINNLFKESELRLTPPALFSGKSMKIITPSVKSGILVFQSIEGQMIVDIGFEGE